MTTTDGCALPVSYRLSDDHTRVIRVWSDHVEHHIFLVTRDDDSAVVRVEVSR